MSLQGNLRDFSATEILQLVATQRKTGCLMIEHASGKSCIHVLEGRVVSTRAGEGALAEDRLWQFLHRIRRMSATQFMGIESMHAESQRDLEELILEGHYMPPEDLDTLLERQILDHLTEIIEWNEGSYRFDADRRWRGTIHVRLSIEASLIEAARRADERKRYQQLFEDGRQIVSVRDLPDPDEEIADEESELFGIIDGQRTVAEVITAAPLTDYEASEALQRMIEAGWVEFSGRREGAEEPTPAAEVAPVFRPTVARSDGLAWPREAAAIVAVAITLFGVWNLGRVVQPPASTRTASAFEEARVRDVRYAIELYRREHGEYPTKLEELVEDRWLAPADLNVAGRPLHYRREIARDDYRLDVVP